MAMAVTLRKTQGDMNGDTRQEFSTENGETLTAVLNRKSLALGIFLISGTVLSFELVLTRIFSFSLFSHLAFLVVSTALFGFGLSGVYLSLAKSKAREGKFGGSLLGLSLSIILAYVVINTFSFKLWEAHLSLKYLATTAIWYAALVLPFFFAGLSIARLLSLDKQLSSVLYGVDLLGAATGSLAFIPMIYYFGAEGSVFVAAATAALAGVILATESKKLRGVFAVLAVAFLLVSIQASSWFPVKVHAQKRSFIKAQENGWILDTKWSTISRVDLAEVDAKKPRRTSFKQRALWIDGGTNHSGILNLPEDFEKFGPQTWSSIATAYHLKQDANPKGLVIGSSGGAETFVALSHKASHVDALEMDPSIVSLVNRPDVAEYMGHLFQNPKVSLINDEGRSFLRRQPENTYDVIQFVNNYTPVAIAAGALNLSETFLLTTEAVKEYYTRLRDGGILAIHKGATLRFALTVIEALRELGVENPENQICIVNGEWPYFEGFFLKKGAWTTEETDKIHALAKKRGRVGGKTFLWLPSDRNRDNIYTKVITAPESEQKKYYKNLGVNLFPATDDRPFLEHMLQFGRGALDPALPKEFAFRNSLKVFGMIPEGDFPYIAILVQSIVFAFAFVVLPLVIWGRTSFDVRRVAGITGYFAALGFGFIVIEICLMKRYVLFLGNPAYSIATVVVALLASAGVGSLITSKIGLKKPLEVISVVVPLIALLVLAEAYLSPIIFNQTLHLEFPGRVAIASLVLAPIGVCMGMPFALGLRIIHSLNMPVEERKKVIAWAWGINAYATVVGSALSVYVALFLGFKIALFTALIAYLLGLVAIRSSKA